MKCLRNPLFLILFVTLPQAALIVCLAAGGALAPIFAWPLAVGVVAAAAVLALVYALAKGGQARPWQGMLGLLLALQTLGTAILAGMLYFSDSGMPWAGPEALTLLLGGVSILYLCLALYAGKADDKKIGWQLALVVALPFGCAMLLNSAWEWYAANTVMMNLGIALLVAALVYFVRWLAAFGKRKQPVNAAQRPKKGLEKLADNPVMVGIFALAMPLAGLLLNLSMDNIFGDFSNPWFFVIAAGNGVLMLPAVRAKLISLPYLYLKLIGFSLVVYLTVALLPALPYGVMGILALGLGLLVFSPMAALVLEVTQLVGDAKALGMKWHKAAVALVICAGAVTMPLAVVGGIYADKANYAAARQYLDPRIELQEPVDRNRLASTLAQTDAVDIRDPFEGELYDTNYIPLYSTLYHDIVFGGRTLSRDSADELRVIFFDVDSPQREGRGVTANLGDTFNPGDEDVRLNKLSARTEYDEADGVYKTWVDMEITNTGWGGAEYAARFDLPAGCFVTDYYLYVGEEQKFGMLAERRAAQVTYEDIAIVRNQDPGILYYTDADTLEMRVYPFAERETRRVGFCVMHTQPETVRIDGREARLEAPGYSARPLEMESAVLVPAEYKEKLPAGQRQPSYWFIVDASENSPVAEHILKIHDYAERHGITDAQVVFASYRTQQVALDDLSVPLPRQRKFDMRIGGQRIAAQGGFNLRTAMYRALRQEFETGDAYPVVIAVSDNILAAAQPGGSQETIRFPESEYYYNLGYDLKLTPYRFSDNGEAGKKVKEPIVAESLQYGGWYVDALPQSSAAYKGIPADGIVYGSDAYENAFLLVQKSLMDETDMDAVRDSFRQGVLSPVTAFTVFETAAQEKQLLDTQERIMNGDYGDGWQDALEIYQPDVVNMDEGVDLVAALMAAAGLAALVWLKRRGARAR